MLQLQIKKKIQEAEDRIKADMKARYVDPLLLDVKNAQGEIASLKKENADLLQTIKRMDASMASKTETALEKLQEKLTLAITKKTDEVAKQCNENITKVKDETSMALTNTEMPMNNGIRHQKRGTKRSC